MNAKSPFDHGLFFPTSSYTTTLDALEKGVAEGASLITCIGGEGYGKTLLCRALEQDFSSTFLVVSFPYSVKSFEYVVQIIALKLQMVVAPADEAAGSSHLLLKITESLRAEGKRLLILFDEAEKLYLATLERIRKMLDLVNDGEEIFLQIVLFGREGLRPHLEQLTLCSFKEARSAHLVLSPITEEEAFQYIQVCMQQSPVVGNSDAFSREAAARIFTLSGGNFRKINKMAGDALSASLSLAHDAVGVVAPEHVLDPARLSPTPPRTRRPAFQALAQGKMLGAAAAFMGVVLLFFFLGDREEAEPKKGKTAVTTIQKTADEPPKMAVNHDEGAEKDSGPSPSVMPPEPPSPPLVKSIPAPPSVVEPAPAPQPVVESVPSPPPLVKDEAVVPKVTPVSPPVPAEAKTVATPPVAPPLPTTTAVKPAPETVRTPPEPPTLLADKRPIKKETIPHLTSEPVVKKNSSNVPEAEPLTQKGLAVGEQWRKGKKNELYTLQVMVLAAEKADEKLKTLLQSEKERKGGAGFVLLKKTTSPATITLFYGEFSSLAEAKDAQSSLPPSLQKYNPYPVSIKKAVGKN